LSLFAVPDEESKEGDEDDQRRALLTVADYSQEEIDEDITSVDWDFAYNEVLKIDERKRDKVKLQQEEAMFKERVRIEQEMETKLEDERRRNMDEVQRMMDEKQRNAEELKMALEQMMVEKEQIATSQGDAEKDALQVKMQGMLQKQEMMERQYQLMQEETHNLQRQKAEIEEKARRDREESQKHYLRMEEQKKEGEKFSQQMKEVSRKIIEANECMKFMRKNIQFSQQVVAVMPESFRLDPSAES
jgi:hypothetical protein